MISLLKGWRPRHVRWGVLWDWIFFPLVIGWFAFEPNFVHGSVEYAEASQYLGPIHRLFHGQVLYRDCYTVRGPLFLYPLAAVMGIFGKTLAVLRGYFQTAEVLRVLAGVAVSGLLYKTRLFRILTGLLLVVETHHPYWNSRGGGFRLGYPLLIIGCLLPFARDKKYANQFLLAGGVLTGVGLFDSLEAGVLPAATTGFFLTSLWLVRRIPLGRLARALGTYLAGVALAAVPFMAWLAAQGALPSFLRIFFIDVPFRQIPVWTQRGMYPTLSAAMLQATNGIAFIASGPFKVWCVPVLLYGAWGAVLLGQLSRRRLADDAAVPLILMIYGSLLALGSLRAVGNGQYYMQALPVVILLAGWTMERCFLRVREALPAPGGPAPRRRIVPVIAGILLLSMGWYFAVSEKQYFRSFGLWGQYQRYKDVVIPGKLGVHVLNPKEWATLECPRGGGVLAPRVQQAEIDSVVRFLQGHTAPDEPVFTFPEHGIFNFLADRPGVSRFDLTGYAWADPRWRTELLEQLKRQRPRFAVTGARLSILASSIGRREEVLPEVVSYLAQHYRVVGTFSGVVLLKRHEEF